MNRRAIRWQPVLWGIALQLILAVLILRTVSCSVKESVGAGLGNLSGRV
ncbi:MAG: Na+ dependent nucleoside transporter N-terminal domain-containing protein [Coleofasciculus sp.]